MDEMTLFTVIGAFLLGLTTLALASMIVPITPAGIVIFAIALAVWFTAI